jgi:hypothetical protein
MDGLNTLPDAGAEARGHHVLAYNFKRLIKPLGIAKTMKAMRLAGA